MGSPLSRYLSAMLPKNLQYAILAVGAITIVVVLAVYFWPEDTPDPPEVLYQRIMESESVEVRAEAAEDMVWHGENARGVVGEALSRYESREPEVVVPLIQAVQKARDHKSIPQLFKLMEDPDPRIRGKAGAAVRKITGADYGFRAGDPPEKRAEVLRAIRETYAKFGSNLDEYYPYEE